MHLLSMIVELFDHFLYKISTVMLFDGLMKSQYVLVTIVLGMEGGYIIHLIPKKISVFVQCSRITLQEVLCKDVLNSSNLMIGLDF